MSIFETILLCMLIPLIYILTYIAGKYDILTLICKALQEKVDEYANKEKWKNVGDPVEDLHKLIDDCEKQRRNPPPCNSCVNWLPHFDCMNGCEKYGEWEKKRKENEKWKK